MAMRETAVKQGRLAGTACVDPAITVFKGIPFMKPPVGELRWRAPQPPEPWEGVREAYTFSPKCMQAKSAKGSFYQKEFYPYEEERSEDSLYLNVWTPADKPGEKLPVFFWIYGGAFVGGYSFSAHSCGGGEGFGRQGVVLVNINYRLGAWGFLAHPELSAESEHGVSGNYAILDMIAALKWVRENIEAFGGDPDNVTIGGQSAGGMATQILCMSQLTKGLFKRAILESGSGVAFPFKFPRKAEAEAFTDLKAAFGVDTIAEARAIPAEELQQRLDSFDMRTGPKVLTRPVVDGYVLTEADVDIANNERFKSVEYLFGHNGDEGSSILKFKDAAEFEKHVRGLMGEDADAFLALYDGEYPLDSFGKTQQDLSSAAFAVRTGAGGNAPYVYRFTRRPPGDDKGAFHACELMYVFQTFIRSWRPMTGVDFDVSMQMLKYWSSFIKCGDPNCEGLPVWKPYTQSDKGYLEIGDSTGMREIADDAAAKLLMAKLLAGQL